MHNNAHGLLAIFLAASAVACGNNTGFSDQRGHRSEQGASGDAVGGGAPEEPTASGDGKPTSEGDGTATVEVVPEGNDRHDGDQGTTGDQNGDKQGTILVNGEQTSGGGSTTGDGVTADSAPTDAAPADGAQAEDSNSTDGGSTAGSTGSEPPSGAGTSTDSDGSVTPPAPPAPTPSSADDDDAAPAGGQPSTPVVQATDDEVAACAKSAGGKGPVMLVNERDDQQVTANSMAVFKVTGNQSTFTLTVKSAVQGAKLKALCLFVTGNKSNVTVDLQASVDHIIYMGRGNQSTVVTRVPAGATVAKYTGDIKGKGGSFTFKGEGSFPK